MSDTRREGYAPEDQDPIETAARVTGRYGNIQVDQDILRDIDAELARATPHDFKEDPEGLGHYDFMDNPRNAEGYLVPSSQDGARKKKRRGRLMERFMSWADPLNYSSDSESARDPQNWPKKLSIGYMTEVKKKDLVRYIGEWVVDNAESKSACFYQIIPWDGGFAYEIQEGGAGFGVLRSALSAMNELGEATLPANDRNVQLVRKSVGFSTYMPNELEDQVITPNLQFKDALKPVYSRHHGLMVAGIISVFLGVFAFLAAWFAVYSVYDKNKVPVYPKPGYQLPSHQLQKVEAVLAKPGAYLNKLVYQNGAWRVEEKAIPITPPTPTPGQPQAITMSPEQMKVTTANPGMHDEASKQLLKDLDKAIAESQQ